MKTQGGIPAGTGGMGRTVYTKHHVFRIQKEKGNYGKGGEQNSIWRHCVVT